MLIVSNAYNLFEKREKKRKRNVDYIIAMIQTDWQKTSGWKVSYYHKSIPRLSHVEI